MSKLPRLLEEGIRSIAICGYNHVYSEIIEEYGEKLKQDFMTRMKEKMKTHTEIQIQQSLNANDIDVRVLVDVKGVEWK